MTKKTNLPLLFLLLSFLAACKQNIEPVDLSISTQPADYQGFLYDTTTLSVSTSGDIQGELYYQWYKATDITTDNFILLENETKSELVIQNNGVSEISRYYVVVTDKNDKEEFTSLKSRIVTVDFTRAIKIQNQSRSRDFEYNINPKGAKLTVEYSIAKAGEVLIEWHKKDYKQQPVKIFSETKSCNGKMSETEKAIYTIQENELSEDNKRVTYFCTITLNEEETITSSQINVTYNSYGDIGPFPYANKAVSNNLDYIFNLETLGTTELTVPRSEWNTMLSNFDIYKKNEVYIHADYQYKKDDFIWNISDVGIRIRGNTSRTRPQISETGEYTQSHFQVDFSEFAEDDKNVRMAGSMKSVTLKRFYKDGTYAREIYGYNFMRHYGIWTAPRSCYTHLFITIEDENGTSERIDYGVYEMVEHVNKYYVKERAANLSESPISGNLSGGEFQSSKGDLWKCWRAPLLPINEKYMGVEHITTDPASNLISYHYILKTNKDELSRTKPVLSTFITELNNLDTSDTEAAAAWYNSRMDVDLFLKTYAAQVVLCNSDDYWRSGNNYYLYFDSNNRVCYIPYDLDVIYSSGEAVSQSVFTPVWKNDNTDLTSQRPLIQKALEIPAFKEKYIAYLTELINDDYGDSVTSKNRIEGWQSLIEPYINSSQLVYIDTYPVFKDEFLNNTNNYKMLDVTTIYNYFYARRKKIAKQIASQTQQ